MKALFHPRRKTVGAIAMSVMSLGALAPRCAPAPAAPAPAAAAAEAPGTWDCVTIANSERAAAGLAPLTANAALDYAAIFHSKFQARRNTMTHTGSGGSSAGQRIAAEGYSAWTWGENVAAGYTSCADVMVGWMNSPGHRANILNPALAQIGMGAAVAGNGTIYWTMDLATPG